MQSLRDQGSQRFYLLAINCREELSHLRSPPALLLRLYDCPAKGTGAAESVPVRPLGVQQLPENPQRSGR